MIYGYTSFDIFIGFFFQAEDGIRDLVRSRGLGDVYKRQTYVMVDVKPDEISAILKQQLSGFSTSSELEEYGLSLIHI